MLQGMLLLTQIQRQIEVCAHPKIPSLGDIPEKLEAAPMGCCCTARPGASVTVSFTRRPGIGIRYSKQIGLFLNIKLTYEISGAIFYALIHEFWFELI